MFTDMVGYTALGQKNESLSLALVEEQRKVIRPILARHYGREVKTMGDAFLVEFPNAVDAVRCAYDIQRAVREFNLSLESDMRIHLRIGVHVGEVVESQGDISGDAVNVASRIEPLAEDGGVCVTSHVFDFVRGKVDLPLMSIGSKELKNVTAPVEVYRMVMPWDKAIPQTEANPSFDSHRIAVLPLVDMIPDPAEEYFADGMTEELISAVSKVPELSVISHTSVTGYKNRAKQAAEISRELKVGTLLEGSVRKAGNRVRVAVQLIDANSDRHLWAENYDRNLEDVFAIQSEIAQSVAGALKIHLLGRDLDYIKRAPTTDQLAHDLYMKGQNRLARSGGSEDGLMAALGYFEQAVQRDTRYVAPYCGMAFAYYLLAFHEMIPSKEAFAKIDELAKRALELDDSSPDAHLSMALVLVYQMDPKGVLKEVERALELNPNSVVGHTFAAVQFVNSRQFQKAHSEIQRMLELDPLSEHTMNDAATQYLYSGETDRAIDLYKKILEMDPGNSFALGNLGLCYVRKGLHEAGFEEMRKSVEMEGRSNPNSLADLPYALSKMGRVEEARKVVAELVERYQDHGTGAASVARGYAAIGERDKAFEWMEKAYEEHAPMLRSFSVDFNFEEVHSDPRYLAFLKRLGLDIT